MKDNTTLVGQTVQRIRSMIIAGDFPPGHRLLEDVLTEELGVGRTPLREALLILQGAGNVERRHGWYVPETKPGDLPSLFNARCYAEGALAALAATRAKAEHVAGLDRVCTQMERWPEISRGELNKLNTAFHDAIRDIAANRYLAGFRDQVMFHHWQLRMPVMFTDAQIVVSHQEHRAILAGIKAGDPDAAERAARAHVNTTRAIVIEVLESMAASRAAAGAQDPSSILNL